VSIDDENLSGTMNRNDIFQWTPQSLGTYDITCEFHPQMKAAIEVVEELPPADETVEPD
jgi:plastocyanin